ncbi:hypothetical protein ACOMHN_017373 [Nucella lapillus]
MDGEGDKPLMKDKTESGKGDSPPAMADSRKRKRPDTELIHDSEATATATAAAVKRFRRRVYTAIAAWFLLRVAELS